MIPMGVVRLAACVGVLSGASTDNAFAANSSPLGLATVEVLVTAEGVSVHGATVFLDLDASGTWDEDLDEPIGMTDELGVVVFTSVTGIEDPHDFSAGPSDERASAPMRLQAGRLRGNPAAECLTLAFTTPALTSNTCLEVFDLRGARVGWVCGSEDLSLALASSLPSGVYAIRLSDGRGDSVSRRFTRIAGRPHAIRATYQPESIAASEDVGVHGGADKIDGAQSNPINVIVEHPGHPIVIQPEQIVVGYNQCTVEIGSARTMRFMVYGDTHAGYAPAHEVHEAIVATAVQYQPELVVHLGDMVHGQTGDPETNWGVFDEICGVLTSSMPFLPTVGNHDVREGGLSYYFDYFDDLPNADQQVAFYHIEHPHAVFVVLDVDSYGASSNYHSLEEQFEYASTVLQQFAHKPYAFVSYHIPTYTGGARGPAIWARAFGSLFIEHQVSVVFSGHTHAYERFSINGLDYVVAGGGGGVPHAIGDDNNGAYYPFGSRVHVEQTYHYLTVEGDTEALIVTAWDLDGQTFDSFVVMARQSGVRSAGVNAVSTAPVRQ